MLYTKEIKDQNPQMGYSTCTIALKRQKKSLKGVPKQAYPINSCYGAPSSVKNVIKWKHGNWYEPWAAAPHPYPL